MVRKISSWKFQPQTTVSRLTQDKRWRCMTLREPRLLGDVMGVGRGEARGEIPLKTASQIQRGSASLQSTPTEHWNFHSWPDGAGATPDTLSIAPPHSYAHVLSVTHQRSQGFTPHDWDMWSPPHDFSQWSIHRGQKWQSRINQWKTLKSTTRESQSTQWMQNIKSLMSPIVVLGSALDLASSLMYIFLWVTHWIMFHSQATVKPWWFSSKAKDHLSYFVQFSTMFFEPVLIF